MHLRRVISGFVGSLFLLAGQGWAEAQYFQSPSGNIQCVINDTAGSYVRCDLGVDQQSYTQRPKACDGDWGMSFGLTATGTGFLNCVTDAIGAPNVPLVLQYGVRLQMQEITCESETTGMTCTNSEGGGFSVRRSEQRIF